MTESRRASDKLAHYRNLLQTYRTTLNLVSPTNPAVIDEKLAEGGVYARLLERHTPPTDHIADLGSGSGLPGIVIAILQPDRAVHLIERRRRRVAFMRMAIAHLGLSNVSVHAGDASALDVPRCRAIVAQAVGTFEEIYCVTNSFHADEVLLVSRKGASWQHELDRLERRISGHATEVVERRLEGHGSLIGLRIAGGRTCRSSG